MAASTALTDGEAFFELFRQTISYKKLAGLTRGQRRIVGDDQLIECFESFIAMANFYSPENPYTPFVIEELEINPFAFTDYLMVPLDGMCRFSVPGSRPAARPVGKIGHLLHPERIGIVGVSAMRRNFGRIILDNVLAQGFGPENVTILREGGPDASGVACVPGLASLPHKLDLLVVAVNAAQVPDLVEEVIARDAAQAVMLIPGGMGETEDSRERAAQVMARIDAAHGQGDGGPVFLGANCMGVVSRPGSYDTWFIPEEKLPRERGKPYRRAALVSQSGAFMLHRSSQCPELAPAYMISMGNQTDLTLGDMVSYFKDSEEVDVIAVYAEGFNDLDGLAFCKAVRGAVLGGKEVVFYKAGRTPEGKSATSGHTASLAGDYMVCESCVRQAGAIVAQNFNQFQDLFLLAETLHGKKIRGNRLAALSGAGFEAVGMADSIQSDDYAMQLAPFAADTVERIGDVLRDKRLDRLVSIVNPLDINPAADDEAHARIAAILAEDPGVDAVVMGLDPLSPAMHTLADTDVPAFDVSAACSGFVYALAMGHRVGFIGSSDTHVSIPGGAGLEGGATLRYARPGYACVYAPRLTKADIFEGLRARRCYATTGIKMLMDFYLNGKPMGSEVQSEPDAARNLRVYVAGTDRIEAVEIVRNGQTVHTVRSGWIMGFTCRLETVKRRSKPAHPHSSTKRPIQERGALLCGDS